MTTAASPDKKIASIEYSICKLLIEYHALTGKEAKHVRLKYSTMNHGKMHTGKKQRALKVNIEA